VKERLDYWRALFEAEGKKGEGAAKPPN